MRNEKNRLKRDTARFRGYSQNTRCLEEIFDQDLTTIRIMTTDHSNKAAKKALRGVKRC